MDKIYRYELEFLGEQQEIGFLVGLKDIGISETIIDNFVKEFDEKLVIPNYSEFAYDKRKEYPSSYFTEKGRKIFYPKIKMMIKYVEDLENGWEIVEKVIEKSNVLYEDELQVIVLEKFK